MAPWLWSRIKLLDWWIVASVVILLFISLLVLWSMSNIGEDRDLLATTRLSRQMVFAICSIAIIIIGAMFIDMRAIEQWSIPLFVMSLVLLAAVLVVGHVVRGTRGWFELGLINIQPVELAKVGFILLFATLLKRWARRMKELRALLMSAVGVATVGGLILLEPDFGSFFVFLAVWVVMIMTIGLKRTHVLAMLTLTVVGSIIAWNLFAPYQRDRLEVFLHPESDPLGRGYQLRQSVIAIGSGGFLGKGLGGGSQSQLQFLPERQTDFLFAVVGEELGLVGVTMVLGLWMVIILRLVHWSSIVRDDFALFTLLGFAVLFSIEVMIVVGMNMGVFPITGLTLPLVSYGGSSMIATAFALMITQSIIIEARRSGWAGKYQ